MQGDGQTSDTSRRDAAPELSRRERRVQRRRSGWRRPALMIAAAVVVLGGAGGVFAATRAGSDSSGSAATSASTARSGATVDSRAAVTTTTSTRPTTTTTTIPSLVQPPSVTLPPLPGPSVGPGASGSTIQAYQQRLADLHFDPGTIDGNYGSSTVYAVQSLQKVVGLPPTGRIGPQDLVALQTMTYAVPLQPTGEPNRTEVDITKQVLTLYQNYQVRLITTVSTGAGESYCYSTPRVNPTRRVCEVATTPSGRFTYTRFVSGWDPSPLGRLYNPFYFNGGIAVHGYPEVPTHPASHGCVRIPMYVSEYFHTLVNKGDPVYVFGGRPARVLSSSPIAPAPTTTASTAPAAPGTEATVPAAPAPTGAPASTVPGTPAPTP